MITQKVLSLSLELSHYLILIISKILDFLQEEEFISSRDNLRLAQEHSMELTQQATGLDSLLSDSRHTSENAVAAATSYQNIVKAVDEALQWAQGAEVAGKEAQDLSSGGKDRAAASKQRSAELLTNAKEIVQDSLSTLRPRLETAQNQLATVEDYNNRTLDSLNFISAGLDKILPNDWKESSRSAIEKGTETQKTGTKAHDLIKGIHQSSIQTKMTLK